MADSKRLAGSKHDPRGAAGPAARPAGLGGALQSLADATEATAAQSRFGPLLLGVALATVTTAGGVAALAIVLTVLVRFG